MKGLNVNSIPPSDGHLAPVDARAERLVAGARDDDRPHGVVLADVRPHRRHLVAHRRVERVVGVGSIEGDRGDAVVAGLVPDGGQARSDNAASMATGP